MAKSFFEVFPQVKLNREIAGMLDETVISRVSTTSRKDFLRIYLSSGRLLSKERIYLLERELKQQLFPHHNLTIKIIESFHLSEQYNLKNLLDAYWNSILTEFRNYSLVEYNLLRQARMEVTDEHVLHLTLEDSVLSRQKEGEIYRILEKIFNERCNLQVQVEIDFCEKKESRYRKNADIQIHNEVEQIVRLSSIGSGKKEEFLQEDTVSDTPWESGGEKKKDADGSRKAAGNAGKDQRPQREYGGQSKPDRKGGFGGSGRDFRERPLRRSDNPDVIYGRDFEDEAIRIDQIAGEMGDVVIRGKVLSVDEREIRNEKTILMFSVTDFTDTIMVKMFCRNEQLPEIKAGIFPGAFLKIKGVTTIDRFDHELTIGSILGMKKIPSFVSVRMDTHPEKRVELHCHTKMSDMDGVSDVKDIIKRAMKWGHKAIAITDHGDDTVVP